MVRAQRASIDVGISRQRSHLGIGVVVVDICILGWYFVSGDFGHRSEGYERSGRSCRQKCQLHLTAVEAN